MSGYAPGTSTGGRASPARRVYRCAHGSIEISCENGEQWRSLARCLGRPELAYEGSWQAASTAAPGGRLGRVIESLFAEDEADTWLRRLRAHGIPCRPSEAQ